MKVDFNMEYGLIEIVFTKVDIYSYDIFFSGNAYKEATNFFWDDMFFWRCKLAQVSEASVSKHSEGSISLKYF